MTEETKQTILIIEDDLSMSMALGDMFIDEGYTVLKAFDGEEGLKMSLALHPDLIFADMKMPKMHGLEMITEIHKDSWGKTAQIVVLSNISDVATIQEALTQGSFFYMIKGDSSMNDILKMAQERLASTKHI